MSYFVIVGRWKPERCHELRDVRHARNSRTSSAAAVSYFLTSRSSSSSSSRSGSVSQRPRLAAAAAAGVRAAATFAHQLQRFPAGRAGTGVLATSLPGHERSGRAVLSTRHLRVTSAGQLSWLTLTSSWAYNFARAGEAKYRDDRVCLSVCLSISLWAYLRTTRPIFTNFYACYLRQWLGPRLVALR